MNLKNSLTKLLLESPLDSFLSQFGINRKGKKKPSEGEDLPPEKDVEVEDPDDMSSDMIQAALGKRVVKGSRISPGAKEGEMQGLEAMLVPPVPESDPHAELTPEEHREEPIDLTELSQEELEIAKRAQELKRANEGELEDSPEPPKPSESEPPIMSGGKLNINMLRMPSYAEEPEPKKKRRRRGRPRLKRPDEPPSERWGKIHDA